MRLRLGLAIGFLGVVFSGTAFGQAVVNGAVVYGNSSKPVAGVEIHLVNKEMKPPVDRVVKTGDDGSYSFDNVAVGDNYAVAVYDATGKVVGTDVTFSLTADSPLHTALPDIDISRGLTAARANKSGGVIQNDLSISPGTNISNDQIRTLPLFNRNFLNLGLIQPGVHDVEQGSALQGGGFSIAGSRSTSTYFLLDGVDNVASETNQAIPFQVNEAVREFRVTYATPSLRYGQGSGGIVDVVTSSGDFGTAGRAWHGSVFGYFNNDSLNGSTPLSVYSNSGFARAASYSSFQNGLDPSYNSVTFFDTRPAASTDASVPGNCNTGGNGTTYNGNRVLFCGYSPQSYNALVGLLSAGSPLTNTAVNPTSVTSAVQNCNTALCSAGAFNPATVLASQDSRTQPITSKQFGGSIGGKLGKNTYLFGSYEATLIDNPNPIFERVPTYFDRATIGGISSAAGSDQGMAQAMLALYPAPNVGQTGSTLQAGTNTGIFGFFRGVAPNYTHAHNVQVRPDVSLGRFGTLAFRYTGQLLDQLHDDSLPSGGAYPGNGAFRKAQNQSAAVSHIYQFGQSRNIASIGFTQFRVDEVAQDRGFNPSSVGLAQGSMPTVAISGIDWQNTSPSSATSPGPNRALGLAGGWYDSFWQTNCTGASGLSNCAYNGPNVQSSPAPITPSLDGNFPLARLGAPLSAPSKHRATEAFFSDVLDLHLGGRDTLTLGGDYRYQQNFSYEGGLARGLVVANNIGEFTHDSETCVTCSSAFAHPGFDYELRQQTGYFGDLRSSSFGVFAENNFKAKDRLNLVTGIRYEYFGEPLDTQNRLWNYNFANYGLNRQGTSGTFDAFGYPCGAGTTFFDSLYGSQRTSVPASASLCKQGTFGLPQAKNDLTGLVGVSYAPDAAAKHVIRAAVGGYFDHAPASYNEKLLQNRPNIYSVTNPSAIYGQNFSSSYSSANCQQFSQCAFGLGTLNFANLNATQLAAFQNYQAASAGTVMYARDVNALKTPYLVQLSASYQYRFSGSWNMELGYVGSLGNQLPLVYDGNFSAEFYCQSNGACTNNTYFPVFTQSNIGNSNYHSIVARAEGRLWKGLSMHASYTYAKSLDNIASSAFPNATDSIFSQLFGRQFYGLGNPAPLALEGAQGLYGSNGGVRGYQILNGSNAGAGGTSPNADRQLLETANIPTFSSVESALTTTGNRTINVSKYNLPQNPLAFSSNGAVQGEDYGRSDFDVAQRGIVDFVYRTPFRGRWASGIAISGITTVQSGQPFTIFSGPAYGQITQRINTTASAIKLTKSPTQYISGVSSANLPSLSVNSNCPVLYAQPPLYKANVTQGACLGNSGRNAFTGPAFFSQDLAAQKSIPTHEGQNLIIRAEFFNIFNRANFYNPISEISPDGAHLNPEFGVIRSAHDPREIQFAVRYDF